jgi:2-methylcitrate dehydratase PrpD
MTDYPSKTLATFAAELRFEQIPQAVVRRAEDLLLDWFGSALAGKGARPVRLKRSSVSPARWGRARAPPRC